MKSSELMLNDGELMGKPAATCVRADEGARVSRTDEAGGESEACRLHPEAADPVARVQRVTKRVTSKSLGEGPVLPQTAKTKLSWWLRAFSKEQGAIKRSAKTGMPHRRQVTGAAGTEGSGSLNCPS